MKSDQNPDIREEISDSELHDIHRKSIKFEENDNTFMFKASTNFGVILMALFIFSTGILVSHHSWFFDPLEYNLFKSSRPSLADLKTGPVVVTPPGKKVYKKNCLQCHQKEGQGMAGTFPPLAGSDWVSGDADIVVKIILKGIAGEIVVNGETYNGVMPPFEDILSDEDVSAVVNYIRTSWGNNYSEIDAATVAKIRDDIKSRRSAWTADDLK